MTNEEARDWVDIARMGYICDPQECGLEKGKDPCKAFHCDEIHDALVMAIEALEKQIPKKLIETEEFVEGSCQNCKRNIGWIKDEYFDFDNCPFCGQAIDWSDADERTIENYFVETIEIADA